jgi:hypothetical protein
MSEKSERYFAPDGTVLSYEDWKVMYSHRRQDQSSDSWWRHQTEVSDEIHVSTVWLGMNHQWDPDGPPLFWETMVFGGEHDEDQWRYSSRESALDHHERIVTALRAGEEVPEP